MAALSNDLHAKAIVLRRTNYGESDRILSLLTPEGKVSVLARGVRKERSRLAGGIELFTIADIVAHKGRGRLATLTSAKMLQFFSGVITDIACLELAASFLKRFERATDQVSSPEYFSLLSEILSGLNAGFSLMLVEIWGLLNLSRINGEELNLIYDINGDKLDQDSRYNWDITQLSLKPDSHGDISAREIKFIRFLLSNKLAFAVKVDGYEELLPRISILAKSLNY